MDRIVATTLFSLALLALLSMKGIIKNARTFTDTDFLSVGQTDWMKGIAIVLIMYSHFYPRLGLTYSYGGGDYICINIWNNGCCNLHFAIRIWCNGIKAS